MVDRLLSHRQLSVESIFITYAKIMNFMRNTTSDFIPFRGSNDKAYSYSMQFQGSTKQDTNTHTQHVQFYYIASA